MLLQPFIKVNNAECYYCRVPLHLYMFDAFDVTLSAEGWPIEAEIIKSVLKGVCPNCGRPYEMERRGMGFCTAGMLPLGGYDNEKTTELQSTDAYSKNEFINGTGVDR